MADVASLKKEVAELETKLRDKKTELRAAQIDALPWTVGSVLRSNSRYPFKGGEELRVVGVYDAALGWARVVRKRADGTWGTREYNAYQDFEVVTK